jgi:hypothetical protein
MNRRDEQAAAAVLWSMVTREGPFPPSGTGVSTRCWQWIGNLQSEGYPRFKFNGRTYYARRFAWRLKHGKDPKGLYIADRCGNKRCVRHLYSRAPCDNLVEAAQFHRLGERHPNAKLTEQQVKKIRAAAAKGALNRDQARTFNVSRSLISQIVTRTSWRHI